MKELKILIVGQGKIFCASKIAEASNVNAGRPLVVSAEVQSNVAIFKITGRISQWSEANAEAFETKVDEIINQGIKDLDLYINTEGGSVLVANEIVNQMKRFTGKIRGKGGAIVASAGTYIAVHCNTFSMAKNGQFMIHKPMTYFEGNEDQVESDLKLLRNLTADYKAQYARKTGMSESEIEALWSKGDYWMNASEAKQKGFIDTVDGEENISEETTAILRACGAPIIPKITKPTNSMEINPIEIGLPANASLAEVKAKLKEMSDKSAEADRLKSEAEQNARQEKDLKIKTKLDAAIKAGKIKADQYAKWKALLENDFDSNVELIDSIPAITPISSSLETGSDSADRSKWTYAEWLEKDPEALNKMRVEDESNFEKLIQSYYNEK